MPESILIDAGHFACEDWLDSRQFYSRATLDALDAQRFEPVMLRYDEFHGPHDRGPHVDITLHDPVSEKLLFLLGLPVRGHKLIWPGVVAGWGADVLGALSLTALAALHATPDATPGLLIQLEDFEKVFHGPINEVLAGRTVPGLMNPWSATQVLKRYQFVAPLLSGRVLEVAPGPGLGTAFMLGTNDRITEYQGADLDGIAVDLARRGNFDSRASFHRGDFHDIDSGFDWVVSLETIEHTPDPDEFFAELKSRLKPTGAMVISLPGERWHGSHLNPAHWTNWSFERIDALVAGHFEQVEYFHYERPSFGECPFDIATVKPLGATVDPSWQEGWLAVLRQPREVMPKQRIVVRRRAARGDVLQTTPVVHALRRRHPRARIVMWTDATEVYADNPDVDLLALCSSGFQPAPDDLLVNLDEAYERKPRQHMLLSYAEAAGVALTDQRLRLHPNAWDYRLAASALSQKPGVANAARLVALHMSSTPDRSWPAAHWNRLAELLLAEPDVGVIVVGAGKDHRLPEHPRVLDLVNRMELRSTAVAVALADVLVGSDSFMLHVAGAVGTDAVGLYGIAEPVTRIPVGAHQEGMLAPVECAGCLHQAPAPNTNPRCKFGQAFCLERIAPEDVLTAARRSLSAAQPHGWRLRLRLGGADAVPVLGAGGIVIGPRDAGQPAPPATPAAPPRPRYHFLTWVEPHEQHLLADLLDSLGSQGRDDWHLTVVAPFASPDPLFGELPMLSWVESAPEAAIPTLQRLADQRPAENCVVLPAGFRVGPLGLDQVINQLAEVKPGPVAMA
ncbi:glycosyltransferase family 9 protein [Derxia gummosa]|uniref:Glycosyltransferase family 9 protein n=1 Tax=Derxia gummosa DSM 723 TaxID=1121388 RepID=A0A8B6X6F8_9BURK|nr:glycosyltransferase family 9 protein [Derxia gummosa]